MRFAHRLAGFLLLVALATANSDATNATANATTIAKSVEHAASSASTTTTTASVNELPPIGLSDSLEKLLGESLDQLLEEAEEGEVENHSTAVGDDATGGARAQEPFDLAQLSLALADGQGASPDEFRAVNPQHRDVKTLVAQFMRAYQAEVEATNLDADVVHVIKAETTALRPVLAERNVGLGIELVREELAREFRLFLLVKHRFRSRMFTDKRPYVTALRVSMSCANRTRQETATTSSACDLIDHVDLPRVNESTTDIPAYIRHAIARSALAVVTKPHANASDVHIDAIEAQDVHFDAGGQPVRGEETIESVRFRVSSDSAAPDCMVVVQHARGISSLLYSDAVCYDDLAAQSVATAAFLYAKDNYARMALVAVLVGGCVVAVFVFRRRARQRSGYSYLHSKTGGHLPRLASQRSSAKAAGGTGEPATAS